MLGGIVTNRRRKSYTGFGKTLRRLMWDRDIRSWTQLEELISQATGRRYSHQSMSKYASGATAIPPDFVHDFRDTLSLTEEERLNLAEQYTYHSLPAEEKEDSA